MAIHVQKEKGHEMWCAKQVKNGVAIDFYFGMTMDEALEKACQDKKYRDEEKFIPLDEIKENV